tara:strand:- start:1038 stop:1355 length:318 start_codon:yes stop_codon:yes gene_type:complete
MKNIFGKNEDLELFDAYGQRVYQYFWYSDGDFEDSEEYVYDSTGRVLTEKTSCGYWSEYTRDSEGNELTFKDSRGVSRGFDIPEYTIEEVIAKAIKALGNFKIKE